MLAAMQIASLTTTVHAPEDQSVLIVPAGRVQALVAQFEDPTTQPTHFAAVTSSSALNNFDAPDQETPQKQFVKKASRLNAIREKATKLQIERDAIQEENARIKAERDRAQTQITEIKDQFKTKCDAIQEENAQIKAERDTMQKMRAETHRAANQLVAERAALEKKSAFQTKMLHATVFAACLVPFRQQIAEATVNLATKATTELPTATANLAIRATNLGIQATAWMLRTTGEALVGKKNQ